MIGTTRDVADVAETFERRHSVTFFFCPSAKLTVRIVPAMCRVKLENHVYEFLIKCIFPRNVNLSGSLIIHMAESTASVSLCDNESLATRELFHQNHFALQIFKLITISGPILRPNGESCCSDPFLQLAKNVEMGRKQQLG